jgi:ABC-type nitrate/sulfonate/bicarbonate transport system substrate-binding protein
LPNFLRRKLQGAPILGLATEWKSTMKGNGVFVLADGPVKTAKDLEGRLIATHQGVHAIHKYLLRRVYGLDDEKLHWEGQPQEKLLDTLQSGKADAVVLLDQFFFRGEVAPGVRCLYTDGEAWQKLTGFDEMIKHMVAAREDLLRDYPGIKDTLLRAFRESFAYSEAHLEEVADAFLARYEGDREALLASARYPRIEFTFTEREQRLAQAEMQLLFDVGQIPRMAPIASMFAQ